MNTFWKNSTITNAIKFLRILATDSQSLVTEMSQGERYLTFTTELARCCMVNCSFSLCSYLAEVCLYVEQSWRKIVNARR
jgi:hypothetical protein